MQRGGKAAAFTRAFKKSPLFMAKFFWSGPGDMFYLPFAPFHHEAMHKLMHTRKEHIAILAPRGFAKTKIFVALYAVHQMVTAGEKYIVIVSNSAPKARQILRDIQSLIRYPKFKKVYGDLEADSDVWDTSRKHLVNKKKGIDCVIEAKGAKQQILGASEGAARITLLIFDDLMSAEQAKSPERTEQLLNWYNTTALPALSVKDQHGRAGRTINVGTPFEPDDFISEVVRWKFVKTMIYPALDENDRSIWEDLISTKELHEKRDAYIERGAISSWETQYMLNPQAKQGMTFPQEKLNYISVKEGTKRMQECSGIYIMVDMAYTQETYSDRVGITVTAHGKVPRLTCLEATRGKFDQDELFDLLWSLNLKYKAKLEGIFIETKQYRLMRQFFYEKGLRTGKMMNILPLVWKGEGGERGKIDRISMLIPQVHLGIIELVEGMTRALEIEMLSFDGKKKKGLDTLDSFSYNVLYLTESVFCDKKDSMNDDGAGTVKDHFERFVVKRRDEGDIFDDIGAMYI